MQPQRLMVVEDVCEFRGRAVLFPGVDDDRCTRLVGASVQIVRPDGTSFVSRVEAVEIATPNVARRYPIHLAATDVGNPVPVGSEVWLLGPTTSLCGRSSG